MQTTVTRVLNFRVPEPKITSAVFSVQVFWSTAFAWSSWHPSGLASGRAPRVEDTSSEPCYSTGKRGKMGGKTTGGGDLSLSTELFRPLGALFARVGPVSGLASRPRRRPGASPRAQSIKGPPLCAGSPQRKKGASLRRGPAATHADAAASRARPSASRQEPSSPNEAVWTKIGRGGGGAVDAPCTWGLQCLQSLPRRAALSG